jgi:hypothetical protein
LGRQLETETLSELASTQIAATRNQSIQCRRGAGKTASVRPARDGTLDTARGAEASARSCIARPRTRCRCTRDPAERSGQWDNVLGRFRPRPAEERGPRRHALHPGDLLTSPSSR